MSDFVHAMEVVEPKRFLYAAGTMGLDAKGVAGRTLSEQLELLWSHPAILASADMTVANIVRLTSYLRDRSYGEENARARIRALRRPLIPTVAIIAQTLEEDWLVEIEFIAAA